jgi:hypothetical protein
MESDRCGHSVCQNNLYKALFITGPTHRQTQSTQTSAECLYNETGGYVAHLSAGISSLNSGFACDVEFCCALTPAVGMA